MWILRHLTSDLRFYLTPEKQNYTLGRASTDFLIPIDSTISRRHASLVLKSNNQLFVLDEASKFKVFLNDGIEEKSPIAQKKEVLLQKGDRIRFGQLTSAFVVDEVTICTLTSTVTAPDRKELSEKLQKIGAKVTASESDTFTHLTMTQIVITAKQLQSLVLGVPIVTLKYWDQVIAAMKNHKPLPDVKKYLPEMGEPLLKQSHHLFHVNENRKLIFTNKVFYFFRTSQCNQYKVTIETAGGSAKSLDQRQNNVKKNQLTAPNAIIIQYESSGPSQQTQSIDSVGQYVRSKGLRLIPETEIQLAILHCSIEKYCNPQFKFSEHFAVLKVTKSDVLAKATEQASCDPGPSHTEVVIPESEVTQNPLKELNKPENNRTTRSNKRKIETSEQNEPNKVVVVEASGRRTTRRSKVVIENPVEVVSESMSAIVEEIIPESEVREAPLMVELPAGIVSSDSQTSQSSFISSFISTSSKEVPVAKTTSGSSTENLSRRARRRAEMTDDDDDDDPFNAIETAPKRQKILASPVAHVSRARTPQKANQRLARTRSDDDETDLFQLPVKATLFKQASKSKGTTPVFSQTTTKAYERPEAATQSSSSSNQSSISTEGWLSSTNIPLPQPIKQEPDQETTEFQKKVANMFIAEIKPMVLMSRYESMRDVIDATTTILNTSGKNFKGFVKKRNYKPQTTIIGQKFEIIGLTQLKF